MYKVLTIAGSDSSGGAGIQADLKTIAAFGLFGMSAITALTAQNTLGVRSVQEATPDFVVDQIDAVFEDIRPDAVKIGMVSSAEIVKAIAETLKKYEATNIVVDPVMVATSGSSLIKTEAIEALIEYVFPLATVITPNLKEGRTLASMEINSIGDMKEAAAKIARLTSRADGSAGSAVLLKGGHTLTDVDTNEANDLLLLPQGEYIWLKGKRVQNNNTHGTGCTLSSAIACGLAQGESVEEACRKAKDYITGAISAGLDLGQGSGPLDHMWSYR